MDKTNMLTLLELTQILIYLTGKRTAPGSARKDAQSWGLGRVDKDRDSYFDKTEVWQNLVIRYSGFINNRGFESLEELYAAAYGYFLENGSISLYLG